MDINTELAKKWVAALRSGNYAQTQCQLRYNELDGTASYCCLGVLCEVAEIPRISHASYLFTTENGQEVATSSACAEGWWNKHFGTQLSQQQCWVMNDEQGKSFAEIADYIEKTLDLTA